LLVIIKYTEETMQDERLVRLSLRGSVFLLSTSTFDSHPESLLAKAFASSMQMRPTSLMDGDAHFFNRDPDLFRRVVLPFYDRGYWEWTDTDDARVLFDELEYWGLAPVDMPSCGDVTSEHHLKAWEIVEAIQNESESSSVCLGGKKALEVFRFYGNYIRSIACSCGIAVQFKNMITESKSSRFHANICLLQPKQFLDDLEGDEWCSKYGYDHVPFYPCTQFVRFKFPGFEYDDDEDEDDGDEKIRQYTLINFHFFRG